MQEITGQIPENEIPTLMSVGPRSLVLWFFDADCYYNIDGFSDCVE